MRSAIEKIAQFGRTPFILWLAVAAVVLAGAAVSCHPNHRQAPEAAPPSLRQHGYDSLGFYFNQRGFQLDDQCIAIAQLPDYAISRIRGGQWIADGNRTVWEAEFSPSQ